MLRAVGSDVAFTVLSLADQLPGLQIVVPLVGAIVCAFLRRGTVAWVVATITTFALPVIAFGLLREVQANGVVSYRMGGWAPPFGIEFRIDLLNAYVLLLITSISAVVIPFAKKSVAVEIDSDKHAWTYALYLLCLAGLIGMAITGDAFNIFVFMEVSSLAAYILIALGTHRLALLSAYQYLVLGTIGATFYVIGIGFLYSLTGTLNLADMTSRMAELNLLDPPSASLLAALAFIFVGLALKLALFPLHAWLPGAYAHAPSFITVFLAATATKVAVYLLVRFLYTVFPAGLALGDVPLREIVLALSVAAMIGASLVAVFQDNLKRMLAYSSVAQVGYMTLGMALANEAGLAGGLVHLFNHAITKSLLFVAVGAALYRMHSCRIEDWSGLARKMPFTMAAFAIGGLSMVGVPGTAGFITKWNLAIGALELGHWWLVGLIMLSSFIAFFYIGRVVELAWMRAPVSDLDDARPPPLSMTITMLALAIGVLWFGFETTFSLELARDAARYLLARGAL